MRADNVPEIVRARRAATRSRKRRRQAYRALHRHAAMAWARAFERGLALGPGHDRSKRYPASGVVEDLDRAVAKGYGRWHP